MSNFFLRILRKSTFFAHYRKYVSDVYILKEIENRMHLKFNSHAKCSVKYFIPINKPIMKNVVFD